MLHKVILYVIYALSAAASGLAAYMFIPWLAFILLFASYLVVVQWRRFSPPPAMISQIEMTINRLRSKNIDRTLVAVLLGIGLVFACKGLLREKTDLYIMPAITGSTGLVASADCVEGAPLERLAEPEVAVYGGKHGRVRALPDQLTEVGRLVHGQKITVLGRVTVSGTSWLQVQLENGPKGYVAEYLIPPDSPRHFLVPASNCR